jgi:outer membrane protein, heavy metal efflux system
MVCGNKIAGRWFMVTRILCLITILIGLIIVPSIQAQETNRIYLEQLIDEALKNNPEILAARERWRAAQARPSQVRTLPDPEISFSQRNIGSDYTTLGKEDMSQAGGSFVQKIPFPGKLALRGEVAEKEAEREEYALEAIRYNVRSRLKIAYYDLFFVYESIDTIEKDRDILEKFEKTAEARYAVGKGIQQDVLRAQVEITRLIDRFNVLSLKKESLDAIINALLNRPPAAPLGRPAEFTLSKLLYLLEELNQLALQRAPQLKERKRLIEQNQTSVTLAKKEYYPDFTISGGFFSRGDFRDMWEVMVGISIPLYFRTKQDYGVKEAISSLDAAEQSHQATKQAILARIKEFHVSASTAQKQMELYWTGIIPQASLALESSIAAYEVGKVDFLTLLDNLISLLNDELRYYEEMVNFEKAVAQLEEITGPLM